MATTTNIDLYVFSTGEEDAKTSLENLFGAGNSNMKKIDDAIGELRKKSFIVNTEAELNALLTEENLGKTVTFNGELYIIANDGGVIVAKPVATGSGSIDSGIESITIEGTSFIITFKDGTVQTVEIDYESTIPATPADLSYLGLSDQPIIIGDLDAITPVATTYYKHNGASETTYTKGVIYFYDGSTFAPITGGGGGGGGVSDVKINGTSIVADGVANIPYASSTKAGVVSTDSQTFAGKKSFANGLSVYNATDYPNTGAIKIEKTAKDTLAVIGGSSTEEKGRIRYIKFYSGPIGSYPNQMLGIDITGRIISGLRSLQAYSNTGSGSVSYLPDHTGYLLSAPTSWSTGTSGSVTLPSAGLYEVKTGDVVVVHAILYWDGTLPSNELLGPALLVSVGADGLVTISEQGTGTQQTTTISYRKIGIA